MSSSRLNLKNPAVIAVVVVLGVAVTILNLRTFGPGAARGKRRPAPEPVRVQEYPVLPADLGDMVQQARQDHSLPVTGRGSGATARVGRDPFQPRGRAITGDQAGAAGPPAPAPLRCTAVLLGGKRAVALIDGEAYTLGSRLQGMTVVGIDYDGVRLRTAGGENRFLALVSEQQIERIRP